MKQPPTLAQKISRDALISVFLYAVPATLMFLTFTLRDTRPGNIMAMLHCLSRCPHFLEAVFKNLSTWGLPAIMVVLGVIEFAAEFIRKQMDQRTNVYSTSYALLLPRSSSGRSSLILGY